MATDLSVFPGIYCVLGTMMAFLGGRQDIKVNLDSHPPEDRGKVLVRTHGLRGRNPTPT